MKSPARQRAQSGLQLLLIALLLLFAVDWGLLHYRASQGTAYRTLQVEQYLATTLKGNKAEYDYMGTTAEACSRSLFPQAGNPPCWWLQRHTVRWQ